MNLEIKEITHLVQGQFIMGDPKTKVRRAVCDSNVVQSGDLFFSLKGQKVDGHDFAALACRKGAAGVVVSQLDWMKDYKDVSSCVIRVQDPFRSLQALSRSVRNKFKNPVVGVTGSNGKTTTKEMIAGILSTMSSGLSTRGNFNSQLGLPLILSELDADHKWAVLEMGASEPGNIASLCDIARPSIGVITSIGPAHLATFESVQKIVLTKWELMDSLPADGFAILPWGVPELEAQIRAYKKKIVFFGENSSCSVRASQIEMGETTSFTLHLGSSSHKIKLPISGRVNVSNALAAASVGWVLNYPIEKIAIGLENFKPPEMRFEQTVHSSGALIINDAYNANPASMLASIRTLVETYPLKKKILVIGSMKELGQESDKWHFHVGTELGKLDLMMVCLYGEETKEVLNGIQANKKEALKADLFNSHEEIADQIKDKLGPDVVVLVKGSRSMKLEKIIKLLNLGQDTGGTL